MKAALRTRKAPVLVIYNQNSYWHAVYVIGYNDATDNGNCSYTESFRAVIAGRVDVWTRAVFPAPAGGVLPGTTPSKSVIGK